MKDLDRELIEVLKFLPGWQLDPANRDNTWYSAIMDGTGRGIYFNAVRMRGRLYLSGRFNDNCRPEHCEHISVSRNRPARAIAADIQRRFLPWYLEAFAAQEVAIKAEEAAVERRSRVKKELTELLGDANASVNVCRDGETVSIDVRWIPVKVAKAMFKAYNQAMKSAQERSP
jgi:hypothetical protein